MLFYPISTIVPRVKISKYFQEIKAKFIRRFGRMSHVYLSDKLIEV